MPRRMWDEDDRLFRAVITKHYPAQQGYPERTTTHYAGPFTTIGPATAALNKAKREVGDPDRAGWYFFVPDEVTGHVEWTTPEWKTVSGE